MLNVRKRDNSLVEFDLSKIENAINRAFLAEHKPFTDAIIQTIASVVACIIAVLIPKKISWEQMYTQLLSEYLGYDFGATVMGIVFFFNKD